MVYSIADATNNGQFVFDEHEAHGFWSRVSFSGGRGYGDDPLVDSDKVRGQCWVWGGANGAGENGAYGRYVFRGVKHRAHRLAYRDYGNNLADDQVVDHLCRNTLCVRPDHLESVTHAENAQRGRQSLLNRGECRHGHEVTPDNLIIRKLSGKRVPACKICLTASQRKTYLKRKAAGKV